MNTAIKSQLTIAPLQPETLEAFERIPKGTISHKAHQVGIRSFEPLIFALDGMIRYAKSHADRFGSNLSEDYVLGPKFLSTVQGLRGLLDGNGAVAHEMGYTTDSKDNGACEAMFWAAMNAAGFTEADLM